MMMNRFLTALPALCLAALALTACSPQFNWREITGETVPFRVLMPAKPVSFTRDIDLDGKKVAMSMTAAEVGETTFAVGVISLDNPDQASKALEAIRTALVNNIGGTASAVSLPGASAGTTDFHASGHNRSGQPVRLVARLTTQEGRAYQALILGNTDDVNDDIIDTYFRSFVPG